MDANQALDGLLKDCRMERGETFGLLQIGYVSTAVRPQSPEVMHAILATSRRNNAALSVTGLLVAGGPRYLQILEGPGDAVERLIAKIEADERHQGCVIFRRSRINVRSFEGWLMALRGDRNLQVEDHYLRTLDCMTREMPEGRLKQQILAFARLPACSESKPLRNVPTTLKAA